MTHADMPPFGDNARRGWQTGCCGQWQQCTSEIKGCVYKVEKKHQREQMHAEVARRYQAHRDDSAEHNEKTCDWCRAERIPGYTRDLPPGFEPTERNQ